MVLRFLYPVRAKGMFRGAGFRLDFMFSKHRENDTPKKVLYPLLDIETAVSNDTHYGK